MTWRTLLAVSAMASCIAMASPALPKALVVRSAGPSAKTYPPGKALPDSAKISLNPGDSVTVLGPNATKTLRGRNRAISVRGDTRLPRRRGVAPR